jgi:hypothetical protein
MDTLYYSNYCKHSQRILQFLVKGNLVDKINFMCIDKRQQDDTNNQIYIILEDGKRVVMPPNIQSVPSLLLVQQKYKVILGDDIIQYYQNAVNNNNQKREQIMQQVEPIGTSLMQSSGGMNIISEQYTNYDLTPDELSAKGNSGRRQLYNYVSAHDEVHAIQTPPDTYQPDKIDKEMTVNTLQQRRTNEIGSNNQNTSI